MNINLSITDTLGIAEGTGQIRSLSQSETLSITDSNTYTNETIDEVLDTVISTQTLEWWYNIH